LIAALPNADVFVQSYKELFTGVPYNKLDMQHLVRKTMIVYVTDNKDCLITISEVKTAVGEKSDKSDGNFMLTADHFFNAGDDLFCYVALLFSALIVHGYCQQQLNINTLIPIPKGSHVNVSDNNNYCGIALSSILCKIFDHVILAKYQTELVTSDLQCGFKANCLTNMCSLIGKETMAYYVMNNSLFFGTFLDATKAFDRM